MPSQLSTSIPNYPCIFIVGPAGTGKTTLMTRFKLPGKLTYILDCDGNMQGPKTVAEDEQRDFSHVVYDSVRFVTETGEPVAPLMQYQRLASLLAAAKNEKLPDGSSKYGFIGVTSTTTMSDIFANEVRRQMNKGLDYQFQIQDWGKYGYLWTFFIMEVLRGMPCITGLDGHLKVDKGELDQVLRMAIAIPGQTGDLLPARVTDVWLASVEQKLDPKGKLSKHYMITTVQNQRNPNMKTSLRVPDVFEATQPMIDSIVQQILGGQTK